MEQSFEFLPLATVIAGATMLAMVLSAGGYRATCGAIGGLIGGASIGASLPGSDSSMVIFCAVIGVVVGLVVAAILSSELASDPVKDARKSIRTAEWASPVTRSELPKRTAIRIWSLTSSAMAGATFAGLIMIEPQSLWSNVIDEFVSFRGTMIVLILVGLGVCFLAPLHELLIHGREESHEEPNEEPHDESAGKEHSAGQSTSVFTTVRLTLAIAVLAGLEPLQTGFHEMMNREFATSLQVTIVNCVLAGAATYYWAWAAQLRVDSMTRTCFRAATVWGAVVMTPVTALMGLLCMLSLFSNDWSSHFGFVFWGTILLSVVLAALASFVLFGFTSWAGARMIERPSKRPIAMSLAAALVGASLVQYVVSVVLIAVLSQWETEIQPGAVPFWPSIICALGWAGGLALNPSTKTLLARPQMPLAGANIPGIP